MRDINEQKVFRGCSSDRLVNPMHRELGRVRSRRILWLAGLFLLAPLLRRAEVLPVRTYTAAGLTYGRSVIGDYGVQQNEGFCPISPPLALR